MPPRFRHLFFDLDHTLWDFDGNAALTLRDLHAASGFGQYFAADDFVRVYTTVNHAAWNRFHRGEITQAELRRSRFPDTFRALGADPALCPADFGERFITECSTKPGTLPYAHDVLRELRRRGYPLHIISNGFRDSQARKLEASGLGAYFTEVVTTDCTGRSKPDPAVYEHALARAGADPATSLMVGDSLEADVLGAQRAGLTAVFYNPQRERHYAAVEHEITCLRELLPLL